MDDIIEKSYKAYQTLSLQEYSDVSYLSALRVAILTPCIFLKNMNDFEVTFDAIIHHLELSMSKATNPNETALIQRVTQELFHDHIFLIEQKINFLRELNRRGLAEKLADVLKGNLGISEPAYQIASAIGASATQLLRAEVAVLLAMYFQQLYANWKITQKSNFFYVQLIRTYRKIIASKVYNSQYNLINNCIDRNKIDIVNALIAQKDWDEGIEFMASLEYRKPFNYSTLKSKFYRGYRYYFIKRNIFSTYIFFSFISSTAFSIIIISLIYVNSENIKSLIVIATIFLAIYFIRYEHRLIALKIRIRQRVKELSGS